jgi:hypothetical protein
MAKDKLTDYSATNASNTDVGGVNINEGMLPSDVNNAIREVMTHLKDFAEGTEAVNSIAVGNITVSGTVDGRDVAADGTKLDGIATSATANPNAIDNVVEDTSPQLGGDLQSNGNDIVFADNDKAIFGAGSDLQIYHDGSNSYIDDAGTGKLFTRSSQFQVQKYTGENMIVAVADDRVDLYYNNSKKLATTSTGVDVTGTVTADGLTVDVNNAGITMTDSSSTAFEAIKTTTSDALQFSSGGSGSFMNFYTNAGNERMRLTSAGRLGLGVSSPSAGLHVEDDNGAIISRSGYSQYLQLQPANNSVPTILGVGGNGVHIGPTNSTGIRINNSGSVGIGTASPTQEIHGYSGGGDFSLKLESASATGTAYTYYKNADREYATGIRGSAGDSFQIIDVTADTTRLTVDTSGNTTFSGTVFAPNVTLYPNSSAPNADAAIYRPQDGTLGFVSNGSERARFSATGNLLLGQTSTDTPGTGNTTTGTSLRGLGDGFFSRSNGEALYLNRNNDGGMISIRRSNSQVGVISVTTSGTTYNTTSDRRLKQDIEPLQATDKLMQMNPVSYNWKSDPDGPRSMGFIAQEMQEVMPEAVSTGDDDMMSMDYGRITPILVSALQDAHRKIEQLEQRIADMEAK